MSAVEAYLAAHADDALQDLKAFCRIPSVSTDPAFRDGMRAAAGFVADRLKRAGFPSVEILETGGHPAVFGEIVPTPTAPTILVYGHYDVQPPDPLEKWTTPPFEPTIRDGRLYARGVSDDKGPMLIPILVVEAFLKTAGRRRSTSSCWSKARRNRAARISRRWSSGCANASPAIWSSRRTAPCGAPTCRR